MENIRNSVLLSGFLLLCAACTPQDTWYEPAVLSYLGGSSIDDYDAWHSYAFSQRGKGLIDVGCSVLLSRNQEELVSSFFNDSKVWPLNKAPNDLKDNLKVWKSGGAAVVLHQGSQKTYFLGSGYIYRDGELRKMVESDANMATDYMFGIVDPFDCANWDAEKL